MYLCENVLNWFMFKDKASKVRLPKTKDTHRSGKKALKEMITTFVSILNMWYFFNKICSRRKSLLSNFSLFTDWWELKYGRHPNNLEKEMLQQKSGLILLCGWSLRYVILAVFLIYLWTIFSFDFLSLLDIISYLILWLALICIMLWN